MLSLTRSGKLCAAVSAAVLGLALFVPYSHADEAKAPATQPAADAETSKAEKQKKVAALNESMEALTKRISAGLLADQTMLGLAKTLSDPAKRDAAAPNVIPLIHERMKLVDKFGDEKLATAEQLLPIRLRDTGLLYALNETDTRSRIDAEVKSDNKETMIDGRTTILYSDWLGAAGPDKQAAVVESAEKLAADNKDQSALSSTILAMLPRSESAEVYSKLLKIVTETMTDKTAVAVQKQVAAQKKMTEEADAKMNALLDKPMTITGTSVDGTRFSSDEYKGKVVLVDFWATWCVPCKAALPHVKEVYNQYHDKGLEMVGISNDYSKQALVDFLPKNDMHWVQLFDAKAAAVHDWSPLSHEYGVMGIPRMFIIDKKGVCRSIRANDKLDKLVPQLLAE